MRSSNVLEKNATLVEQGDLNALTAQIDSLCFDNCWEYVVDLRDRCRAALQRGKQLWPAAAYAEYRMALDGPPSVAASVLDSPAERFTLGPFAEIIASTHTIVDLSGYLGSSPSAGIVAHERVVRGETITNTNWLGSFADVLDVPLQLQDWEPAYCVAEYLPSIARFPAPLPKVTYVDVACDGGRVLDDRETINVLLDLTRVWCAESNGRSDAVAVEGTASEAIAALGCRRHRVSRITSAEAIGLMAWAAGNGGAHGRRRGMAAGRQAAWSALTYLAGLGEERDVQPEELGRAAAELEWSLWDDGSPPTGWSLRLAIADPAEDLAWAISASDAKMD
jgi:hypothetical protein